MEDPLVGQPDVYPGKANNLSASQAFYNMFCFTVGAGMLGLPHAVLFARGLLVVPVVLSGLLCCYTALLLHRCQLQHGAASYQQLGEAIAGRWASNLVGLALAVNQLGIAVLYVIAVNENVALISGSDASSPTGFLVIGLFGFICSIRGEGLAHISCISFAGLVSVIAVGVLVTVVAATEAPVEFTCEASVALPEALAGLGTAIFAYGGHPVYPEVQGSMAKPKDFGLVIYVSFALMMLLFCVLTQSAWHSYGCTVRGYLLESLDASDWRSAALCGITIHLASAIPIVLMPVMRHIEIALKPYVNFWAVRLAIMTFTASFAYMFPDITDVLDFLGSFSLNALTFFFPIWFYHATFGWSGNFYGILRILFHTLVLFLASAIFVLGSYASFAKIVWG